MEPTAALALNLLLRGAACGVLVLMAAVLWREHRARVAGQLGAAFALGVAAATLASVPGLGAVTSAWHVAVAAVATGSMFVFWLFTRALLDDAFRLRAWHALVWLGLAALGIANCLVIAPQRLSEMGGIGGTGGVARYVEFALGLLPVAWALLAIVQSVHAWREDLVEGRRRLRFVIVGVTALYTVAQLLAALTFGADLRAVVESPLNAAGIAALAGAIVWRLLRLRADELFPGEPALAVDHPLDHPLDRDPDMTPDRALTATATRKPPQAAPPVAAPPVAAPPVADEAFARQVATLEGLMVVQRLYREPSLSIGALALRMGLPEHRLRRVINQGLGHRHFSAFLNGYRIDDARRALRDPARAELPVLMIAMDAGFQSIGPFNRAFKAATGLTPTEYRRGAEPLLPPSADDDPLAAETRIEARFS